MSPREMLVIDTTGRTEYPVEALAHLEGLPVRIEPAKAVEEDAVIAAAEGATAILVTGAWVTRRVMEALQPDLRAVVRYGVGLDRIDLDAARELGVEVRNVRDFCTNEVADHALALLLAVARDIVNPALDVREGHWRGGGRTLHRLSGGVAGIVGLGEIGQAVARRVAALGMALLAHDPYADTRRAKALGARLVGMEELLGESDAVLLTCPLTDETRGIIDADALALMKPTAIIVNTSRGGLIDEPALAEALNEGRLAGAGLDVLEPEPPPKDHPLRELDSAVITPHTAWASEEARREVIVGGLRELAEALRKL
ncbi:MAG: C-terminal binding protein [Armatimonadota bacterium]|jgi:D-3-phosphoglycerate dehydrogenase